MRLSTAPIPDDDVTVAEFPEETTEAAEPTEAKPIEITEAAEPTEAEPIEITEAEVEVGPAEVEAEVDEVVEYQAFLDDLEPTEAEAEPAEAVDEVEVVEPTAEVIAAMEATEVTEVEIVEPTAEVIEAVDVAADVIEIIPPTEPVIDLTAAIDSDPALPEPVIDLTEEVDSDPALPEPVADLPAVVDSEKYEEKLIDALIDYLPATDPTKLATGEYILTPLEAALDVLGIAEINEDIFLTFRRGIVVDSGNDDANKEGTAVVAPVPEKKGRVFGRTAISRPEGLERIADNPYKEPSLLAFVFDKVSEEPITVDELVTWADSIGWRRTNGEEVETTSTMRSRFVLKLNNIVEKGYATLDADKKYHLV